MARDIITIQLPTITNTTAVAGLDVTKKAVTQANGIELKKAQECMRNTMKITVENTSNGDTTVTFKAGGKYPNAMRGDVTCAVGNGKTVEFTVQDPSQFVNADGSILIDFATGFTGNIWATGKPTGIAQ